MQVIKKKFSIVLRIVLKTIFALTSIIYGVFKCLSPRFVRRTLLSSKLAHLNEEIIKINHTDLTGVKRELIFFSPNSVCDNRYLTFSDKEPETLMWIDNLPDGVFFDIGANIGLYSVYYGVTKKSKVYAFECAPFNLPVFARNVHLNSMAFKLYLISNPLGNREGFEPFFFMDMNDGEAGHVFASKLDEGGQEHNFKDLTIELGFSLDYLMKAGLISDVPVNVKIDVDGTEANIIRGAIKTLSNPICRNLLVEVNEKVSNSEIEALLLECGFILRTKVYKKHSSVKNEFGNYSYISNQIWSKD